MDEQAIRGEADGFLDSWNRHDMRAFASLFRDDADFVNVFGMYWRGPAEIERAHRASHETVFRTTVLSASKVQIKQLTSDVATLHMFWDLKGLATPAGEKLPDRRGIMLHVLVRQDREWKITAAQNTDIVQPPG